MSIFGYIAHKDGYWGGICSSSMPPKDLAKFLADFVKDGFEIMTVADRDDYNAKIKDMKPWSDSPYFKPKRSRRK